MRQKHKLPLIFTSIVAAAVVVLSDFAHKYESKVMQAAREIDMKFNVTISNEGSESSQPQTQQVHGPHKWLLRAWKTHDDELQKLPRH